MVVGGYRNGGRRPPRTICQKIKAGVSELGTEPKSISICKFM